MPAQEKPDEAEHSKVDEQSDESFPSSDAPSHSEGGNGNGNGNGSGNGNEGEPAPA